MKKIIFSLMLLASAIWVGGYVMKEKPKAKNKGASPPIQQVPESSTPEPPDEATGS